MPHTISKLPQLICAADSNLKAAKELYRLANDTEDADKRLPILELAKTACERAKATDRDGLELLGETKSKLTRSINELSDTVDLSIKETREKQVTFTDFQVALVTLLIRAGL